MNSLNHSVAVVPGSSQAPWRKLRGPRADRSKSGGRFAVRHVLGALLLAAGLGFAAPAHAVDVNEATAQQLESIRGIGPRTAEIIVRERERGGKFDSLEDLAERVRGIGQKRAQALQAAGLQIGAGEAVAKAPPAAETTVPPASGKSAAKPGTRP